MRRHPHRVRARPSLEQLETRLTPATLVSPTTVTYQDADGDAVTIRASRPIFTDEAAANAILTFSVGGVIGTNILPQQLQRVDLTAATGRRGRG